MITNKDLKRRIIEISYKHKQAHLGSCLTAVDIIKQIYDTKKPNDKFVLSSGHAALALYVVNESCGGRNAEEVFLHHGVHTDKCEECGLVNSSGSLGHGVGIAVGYALSDRSQNVFVLMSDGEVAEGSVWEALRIARDYDLNNLKTYLNFNGYGAYSATYLEEMPKVTETHVTNAAYLPFLQGQDAHYKVMNEKEYQQAMEILS